MRLWHKDLIPALPKYQLVGQWRECCLIAKNLLEKGSAGHLLVNRVEEYPYEDFVAYTMIVYKEMLNRGYDCDFHKFSKYWQEKEYGLVSNDYIFRDWHNYRYLKQCLYNLEEKYDCGGISVEEWNTIIDYIKDNNLINF